MSYKLLISRRTSLRLILLASLILSTIFIFILISRRNKTGVDSDFLHLTVVDHRTDHDSFDVLVPASRSRNIYSSNAEKYAYVTLLCQDSDLPQARVVVFSVKRSKTLFPVIAMTMPNVSVFVIKELEQLGAIIKQIEAINWKFTRRDTQKFPSFDKRCRLSKLNLWTFTEFEKVVYLDSTLLVINVILQFICRILTSCSNLANFLQSKLLVMSSTLACSWQSQI